MIVSAAAYPSRAEVVVEDGDVKRRSGGATVGMVPRCDARMLVKYPRFTWPNRRNVRELPLGSITPVIAHLGVYGSKEREQLPVTDATRTEASRAVG